MWHLDDSLADLRGAALTGRIDVAHPASGLILSQVTGQRVDVTRILMVCPPPKPHVDWNLADHYIRGSDLIATYQESSSRKLRAQIYWHADRPVANQLPFGIEAIVSAQTSAYGVCPEFRVESQIRATEIWRLIDAATEKFERVDPTLALSDGAEFGTSPTLFVVRPPDTKWSYAEMIHPADFASARISFSASNSETVWLSYPLFTGQLEKGVILRARVKGVLLPRDGDHAAACAAFQEFANSAPPLTT